MSSADEEDERPARDGQHRAAGEQVDVATGAEVPAGEGTDRGDDAVDLDLVGVQLGLGLAAGLGLLLGALTCGAWWAMFPLPRGVRWPMPAVGIASAVALVSGYVLLARRLGRTVADWFAFGYVIAMVVLAGVVLGQQALEFVLKRARGSGEF